MCYVHSVLEMTISPRLLQPLHLDIFGCIILCCGVGPVLHKVYSSFPGLCPLYMSSTLSSSPTSMVKTKALFRQGQMSLGHKMVPGENIQSLNASPFFFRRSPSPGPQGIGVRASVTGPFLILVV